MKMSEKVSCEVINLSFMMSAITRCSYTAQVLAFNKPLESFSPLLTEPKSPPLSSPQVSVAEHFRRLLAAIIQSNRKCELGAYDSACVALNAKTSEFGSDAQMGEHGQGNSLWGYDSIARYGKKIF
ncbi:hypothetical protein H0E87_024319 [Populus deltoides]|uniref:Uncharacterized protein n=1 Tax=Populus deltoides TaxID=3696 RepID=A0A8T2X8B4_POPDE|nr:hypothetical protein H0E87_024319 [Populus deltoides]